jgi:predicted regulator of Ras-like GTPase activity (Roadblock/LC7/MglB family)
MKTQTDENVSSEKPQMLTVGLNNSVFTNLAATLTEVRKLKGVNGYILRNNTAAIVDLSEKEHTTDYAMLSSEIHESSRDLIKQYNLADIESMLLEGKNAKMLCMELGENRIAVFMDKACAHAWIVKRILL